MILCFEVESAVLTEIGAGPGLTSKEQEGLVREAVRKVVYDAAAGTVRIDLIKRPDGSARDEAAATDRNELAGRRKSVPRRR